MRFEIPLFFGLLQSFGIASLILVGIWMKKYRGGFAWDGSAKQFNYHPVFMVLSMVFLSSLGRDVQAEGSCPPTGETPGKTAWLNWDGEELYSKLS